MCLPIVITSEQFNLYEDASALYWEVWPFAISARKQTVFNEDPLGFLHYFQADIMILDFKFRNVSNVVFSFVGDSPAFQFYMPAFGNTLSVQTS